MIKVRARKHLTDNLRHNKEQRVNLVSLGAFLCAILAVFVTALQTDMAFAALEVEEVDPCEGIANVSKECTLIRKDLDLKVEWFDNDLHGSLIKMCKNKYREELSCTFKFKDGTTIEKICIDYFNVVYQCGGWVTLPPALDEDTEQLVAVPPPSSIDSYLAAAEYSAAPSYPSASTDYMGPSGDHLS